MGGYLPQVFERFGAECLELVPQAAERPGRVFRPLRELAEGPSSPWGETQHGRTLGVTVPKPFINPKKEIPKQ
jgi:hypothetical protein